VRWRWRLVLGLALWCAPNAEAWANKRVALVIGNSAYQHAPRLPNPSNDATAVAKLIKDIGFDVVDFRRDLVGTDLRRAIREFSQQARGADIAIIFYAGHGIELNGTNYLVPTDGKLEQDFDVEDETVPLDRLLAAIEPARRLRLVILDACRDNPFVKRMKRTIATRAIGQGLAKVELTTSDTLIAFAAKAGSVANDGEGSHSPFTTALLKHLPTPGVDVRLVFGRVRDEVLASTNRKQEPFVYGSLGGSDTTLVPAPAAPPANAAVDTRRDYELAAQVGTPEAWAAFLARYPTGFYADLAREQRAKLRQAGTVRQPAEVEPTLKRNEEESRRAAARKAEAEAKKQREDDERRAKATEAERQRVERERAERERAEREKTKREEAARIERERVEREKAERANAEREKAEREQPAEPETARIAMLPPAAEPAARLQPSQPSKAELVQAIKKELKRVGCYAGSVDQNWGEPALKRSVGRFVKYAKFSGAADTPSGELFDALRGSDPDVCPLECGPREMERNGHCVRKTCPPGHRLGRGGACIELESRAPARHKSTSKRQDERPASEPRSKRADSGRGSAWLKCSHSTGSGPGRFRGSADARRFAMIDACTRSGGKH
jgi:uncharacterized caspase-like protein